MMSLERQNLLSAALAFARSHYHPLEQRMRVDRAIEVMRLLQERDPATDRELFQRDELDVALDLAQLTLLHSGRVEVDGAVPLPPKNSATEELLLEVRRHVDSVIGRHERPEAVEEAVFRAFEAIARLVAPERCTRSLPDGPPCRRDGDCPEHGRRRPGQCIPQPESKGF